MPYVLAGGTPQTQKPRRRLAGADYPSGGVKGYDPCIDNKVRLHCDSHTARAHTRSCSHVSDHRLLSSCVPQLTTYLQRADVQAAIHANTTLPWKWSECSSVVQYSRASLLSSMFPVYQFLLNVSPGPCHLWLLVVLSRFSVLRLSVCVALLRFTIPCV